MDSYGKAQSHLEETDGDLKVEKALYTVLRDTSEDFDSDVDFVFTPEGLKALTFDRDGFVNGSYQIKIQVTQTGGAQVPNV